MTQTAFPILSALIFLPLAGAGVLALTSRGDTYASQSRARWIALFFTTLTFILSLLLWSRFDSRTADFQFGEFYNVFGGTFSYYLGVDGIALVLIALTGLLMPLCILASWDSIKTRVSAYMIAFLIMESLMMGVFASRDIILFYVFFEAGLIPMYLIIGIWGGKRRVYASVKFFLYTLLGSVLMLLAMLYMISNAGSTSIPSLTDHRFPNETQLWLWLAFFASFAIKVPMWPVHTWLPDAHVEAPTAGSVILAGVLLKMGGYGFLRFSLPMFPYASHHFAELIFGLSLVAIIYTSLVALVQKDMKKLIAYSSVAHMAFVTIGLFCFNQNALEGSIFTMLSHGVVSAALFLCVGVLYDRLHTREIDAYGGIVARMPFYAFVFMIFTMASIGLPGLSGFVGEFLILVGAYNTNSWIAFVAAIGVILGAAYMLVLYRQVVFGALVKPSLKTLTDMNWRERAVLLPLVFVAFWMGIYPTTFLQPLVKPVEKLLMQTALSPHETMEDPLDNLRVLP